MINRTNRICGDITIPNSRMTKNCKETLVSHLCILCAKSQKAIYYPLEVDNMKFCCLGVFRKEYLRLVTK